MMFGSNCHGPRQPKFQAKPKYFLTSTSAAYKGTLTQCKSWLLLLFSLFILCVLVQVIWTLKYSLESYQVLLSNVPWVTSKQGSLGHPCAVVGGYWPGLAAHVHAGARALVLSQAPRGWLQHSNNNQWESYEDADLFAYSEDPTKTPRVRVLGR